MNLMKKSLNKNIRKWFNKILGIQWVPFKFRRKDDFVEKIRLNNGQEFELIPMGIVDNIVTKRRKFTFKSDLDYGDVEAQFADDNVAKIEHLNSEGEIMRTYLDCVSLKSLSRDIDAGTYTVELSVDEVERKISDLENNIVYTELALTEIYEMMLGGTL